MFTPYAAAKVVNAALAEVGLQAIPPQMMYNYTTARVNAGKEPLIAFTPEEGIDRDALAAWIAKYIAKKTGRVTDPAQLALF
jgi:hypothetical protein